MRIRNILLIGLTIALFSVAVALISPFIYYYIQLPPGAEMKSGTSLSQLFNGFYQSFDSSIGEKEVSLKILCMNCLPEQNGSGACEAKMAGFIAKHLITPQRMSLWHLKNMYLAQALQFKYDSQTIARTYFAFVASIFKEHDLGSLCKKEFNKSCDQLETQELITLQRGIASGKFPPTHGPSKESLRNCL